MTTSREIIISEYISTTALDPLDQTWHAAASCSLLTNCVISFFPSMGRLKVEKAFLNERKVFNDFILHLKENWRTIAHVCTQTRQATNNLWTVASWTWHLKLELTLAISSFLSAASVEEFLYNLKIITLYSNFKLIIGLKIGREKGKIAPKEVLN